MIMMKDDNHINKLNCDTINDDYDLYENKDNNKNLLIYDEYMNESKFINLCDSLIERINQSSKIYKNNIRTLKKMYIKEMKMASKGKNNKKNEKKKTGFTTNEVVPVKLANLIGIEYGVKMPRTELTSRVYDVIKSRQLYYNNDKRVLRVDDELMEIFGLSADVNNVTDPHNVNGFNFFNLQKYIAKCYNKQKETMNISNTISVNKI